MTIKSNDYIKRLKAFDVCAVSDALDSLGQSAVISGLRRLSGTGRICGRAVTVLLREGLPPASAEKVHLCARALEMSNSESVIVISHPAIDAGGWGGVLTQAAMLKGVQGTIINGPSRDIDEARAINYPIFATATTARTARGRLHEAETNSSIVIQGVSIQAGSYVLADDSGTAVIAQQIIATVLATAERIVAKEQLMIAALRNGGSATEVLGADYEDMLVPDKP